MCLLCWTNEGQLQAAETVLSDKPQTSSEVYWERVKKVADQSYGGHSLENIEISLKGGYEQREYEITSKSTPYGEFSVLIPLFSKKKKNERIEAKKAFLKEASGYLQEIEAGTRLVEILKENVRIKKAIIEKISKTAEEINNLDGQEKRMEEYLKLNERIVAVQAEMKNAERKLEAMLGE